MIEKDLDKKVNLFKKFRLQAALKGGEGRGVSDRQIASLKLGISEKRLKLIEGGALPYLDELERLIKVYRSVELADEFCKVCPAKAAKDSIK